MLASPVAPQARAPAGRPAQCAECREQGANAPCSSDPAPPACRCSELAAGDDALGGAACTAPPPQPPQAQEAPQRRRWYQVIQDLQAQQQSASASASPGPTAEAAGELLREALASAKADEQWNSSGVPELLQRSLDMVLAGSVQAGLRHSSGLLDFVFLVERYRSVAARSSSSASTDSGGSAKRADDGTTAEVQSPGPSSKRARTSCEPADAFHQPQPVPQQQQQPPAAAGTFALPAKPAPRSGGGAAPSSPAGVLAQQAGSQPRRSTARVIARPAAWSGDVGQEVHDRRVTYCTPLSIELPMEHVGELGASLEVSNLAPRKGIKLGEHYVCRCTLPPLSRSQTAKLKSLAQHELVMVAPLEDNGLILVPYLDSHDSLRMVAFFVLVPSS